VKRKTASSRLTRALNSLRLWCRNHRHQKVKWQRQKLAQKLQGHYAYYGITGNSRALSAFHWHAERIWRKWLDSRSQKAKMTWKQFTRRLLKHHPLPKPRIVHSYVRA